MGQTRENNYDFALEEGNGVTLYYKIISDEAPRTVKVTYPTVADNPTNAWKDITKPTSETPVTIPSSVTNDEKVYSVVEIDKWAFYEFSNITTVTIPSSIVSIGVSAFYKCSKMNNVTLPTTLTNISNTTFYMCNGNGFTTITIPETVSSIGECAFQGCSKLQTVNLPSDEGSLTTIGNSAFKNCSALKNVTLPTTVTTIGNDAFYNCSGASFTEVVIPNSVVSLGTGAFEGCSKVSTLNIGTGITTLANNVFKGLSSLTSVTLPSNITTIQNNAFQNCSKLTTINGPGVTTIQNYAFQNCSKLTTIVGPGVTTIGTSAFSTCSKLASINFPVLVSIADKAFEACSSLTTVTIPSTVTSINGNPFCSCTSLATITVDSENIKYTSGNGANCIIDKTTNYLLTGCLGTTIPEGVTRINANAFNGLNGLTAIAIPSTVTIIDNLAFNGCQLASITIPQNTTTIGQYAFASNKLESVILNKGLVSIGNYAFSHNKDLTSIIIPSTVTSINQYSFFGCEKLASFTILCETIPTLGIRAFHKDISNIIAGLNIYVPSNKVTDYKGASNWSTYASNIDNNGIIVFKSAGDWTTESNWSTSPAADANVYIDANCTIPTSKVSVTNMYISNGVTLTLNNGAKLTVTNINNIDSAESLIINNGAQLICNNSVPATVNKTIANAGAKDPKDHWYTISTPVHKGTNNHIVLSETNIISGTYDMFYLKETEGKWINQKTSGTGFASMNIGQGYLYRNDGTDISIAGNTTVGNQTVSLTKTEGPIEGLNLIGNPFPHNIYIGTECALRDAKLSPNFYYLSNHGTWQTGDYETSITPGMGIIVQTSETGNITIYDTNKNYDPSPKGAESATELQFILNGNQYQDIAYAVLNEGYGLSKLEHPNEAAPMLFINHNDKNYAVAHMSNNTRSFNLGLSAKSFGQYTLKYKAKGNVKYLHVIDRLTGNDVDMLLEGEYSFIASPTDNENRFLVVLESLEALETLDGTFAYQNGNDIIVNGEGNLQIFDVMGRLIATQRINGVGTVNVSMTGVYIFKLNEKTQKIVVR